VHALARVFEKLVDHRESRDAAGIEAEDNASAADNTGMIALQLRRITEFAHGEGPM